MKIRYNRAHFRRNVSKFNLLIIAKKNTHTQTPFFSILFILHTFFESEVKKIAHKAFLEQTFLEEYFQIVEKNYLPQPNTYIQKYWLNTILNFIHLLLVD